MKISVRSAVLAGLLIAASPALASAGAPQHRPAAETQNTPAVQTRPVFSPAWNAQEDPFESMWGLFSDMDRMHQRMFRDRGMDAAFSPRMDVTETPEKYTVSIDLPGMQKDRIDIKTSDGYLTISGERKEENEVENQEYHRMERSYGYFERSIPIPEDVRDNGIAARYEKGVLIIDMERQPAAKAAEPGKKIEVR